MTIFEGGIMQENMIIKGDWKSFLTLRNEELLLVKRSHPLVVIFPIALTVILSLFFIGCSYVLFDVFFPSFSLFFITLLVMISVATSVITKILIDWYFHMYILTTRRILELRYTPLTSYEVNDIMLDRVSCTEIDLETNGFINELFDLGDILLTFDRPTHREVFALRDLQGSHQLARYLTQQLIDGRESNMINPIWFKGRSMAAA